MAWGGLTAEYYGLTAGYYCTSILVQAEAGLVMKAGGYGRKWDVLLALVGNVCRWPTMTIRELTIFWEERPEGQLVSRDSGQPFSLADPCVVLGGSFGFDPAAYRQALQAVKALVVTGARPSP
jgi:hypothetical protein